MMGSATYNDSIETTKHGNDSKGIQGYDHLAWDPEGRRTSPRSRRSNSRANPHNSGTKPKLTREATGKKQNNTVNTQA